MEFLWLLLGNLVYAASQYLMLIGMVKLTTPTMVGEFSFGLAVTAPIALFLSFALRAVVISDSAERFSRSTYFRFRFITAAATFFSGVIFVLVTATEGPVAHVVIIIALIKAIESISDLIYGFLQKSAQTPQIAKSMILRGIISAVVANAFLYWSGTIEWLCVGWLIASIGTCLFYDWPLLRASLKLSPKVDAFKSIMGEEKLHGWKALLILALPLGLTLVFSSLEANAPRYFIEGTLGLSSLGLFSALAYPLILTNQLMGSLASAPSPRLAQMIERRDFQMFRSLLRTLILIAAIFSLTSSLVAFLFGKWILKVLNGPIYAAEYRTFIVLSLATSCASVTIFFGTALSAMQAFRTKLILQLISLTAVVTACALAAHHKSLFSMSLALLVGAIVSLISQMIAYELRFRQRRSAFEMHESAQETE